MKGANDLRILKTILGCGFVISLLICASRRPASTAEASSAPAADAGYVLEHEAGIAKKEPGPHKGGGTTTAYPFFSKADGFKLAFRKRALHPGSAIGYHLQDTDEVYYVLSGAGTMTINNKSFPVTSGDAILTRPGSSHGLKQTGKDDLVILINYELEQKSK